MTYLVFHRQSRLQVVLYKILLQTLQQFNGQQNSEKGNNIEKYLLVLNTVKNNWQEFSVKELWPWGNQKHFYNIHGKQVKWNIYVICMKSRMTNLMTKFNVTWTPRNLIWKLSLLTGIFKSLNWLWWRHGETCVDGCRVYKMLFIEGQT